MNGAGNRLQRVVLNTPEECAIACLTNFGGFCKAFMYNADNGACNMYDSAEAKAPRPRMSSSL